jgi:hypothetical protein
VRREQIVTGITTGLLPAAATTGMLVGFGIRLGAAGRVFQAIGAIALGMGAYEMSALALATMLGVLLHVLVMLACGVVYASLVANGEHRAAWAIAIGGVVVAAAFVSAKTFAGSIALVLTPGNLMAIGAVIAITLPIGMRFAPTRL